MTSDQSALQMLGLLYLGNKYDHKVMKFMTRGRHDLKIIRLGLDIKLYFALSRQHAVDRYVMILVIDRLICVFTPEPSKKQHLQDLAQTMRTQH